MMKKKPTKKTYFHNFMNLIQLNEKYSQAHTDYTTKISFL